METPRPRPFQRVVATLLLLTIAVALAWWWLRPRLTEKDVRRVIVATIQHEAPEAFFITGYLDVTATSTVENTKYLLPDLLRMNLGTTRATVRVPGRVSYGLDVDQLTPESIRFGDDGVVEVHLPSLRIYAAEPRLDEIEVQTTVGWARLYASSGKRVELQALRYAQEALRDQGAGHLAASTQPRVNTAKALEQLLTPVLQAAGLPSPRFRFQLGPELIMETPG